MHIHYYHTNKENSLRILLFKKKAEWLFEVIFFFNQHNHLDRQKWDINKIRWDLHDRKKVDAIKSGVCL